MDADPRLLLITDDHRLRDDVALVAATVGAALEFRSTWREVVPREWAVLMCGPDRLPPLQRLARSTLLVGSTARGSQQEQQLWVTAGEHPGLQPVPLPAAESWLAQHLGERVLDRSPGDVVAMLGAVGGAGTSTVAYLFAAEHAVRGASVLLVDADPSPGSAIAALLEAPASGEELGWEELAGLEGEIASPQLAAGLPARDGVHVLTGAPGHAVRRRMLEPVVRSARRVFDLVVIDAGRDTGAVKTLGEHVDQLLLVTPCSARGAATARQLARTELGVPSMLVANGPAHPGWSPQELSAATDMPLAGDLPEQRWLRRADALGAAYELLRSRRGATLIGAVLESVEAERRLRHE